MTNYWEEEKTKIYYFGWFEQFSENIETWEVKAINPRYDEEAEEIASTYRTFVDKEEIKPDLLKNRLAQYKQEAKEIVPENKILNMQRNYKASSTPADIFLKEAMTTKDWCIWSIPCYKQPKENGTPYWCSPTAWAMLYWYHDRNWYSDLIPWIIAPRINNKIIDNIILEIWNYMWTRCTEKWGATYPKDIVKWINYAKNNWYKRSYTEEWTKNIVKNIKNEIDAWRPIIVLNNTHAMVAHWYSSENNNIVVLNMWWWHNSKINWYKTSAIAYDLRSNLYYNWTEKTKVNKYIKVFIKK